MRHLKSSISPGVERWLLRSANHPQGGHAHTKLSSNQKLFAVTPYKLVRQQGPRQSSSIPVPVYTFLEAGKLFFQCRRPATVYLVRRPFQPGELLPT